MARKRIARRYKVAWANTHAGIIRVGPRGVYLWVEKIAISDLPTHPFDLHEYIMNEVLGKHYILTDTGSLAACNQDASEIIRGLRAVGYAA